MAYTHKNHRYKFGSNRYRYWLQASSDGHTSSYYEDIVGSVDRYEPLPSDNIVDIWCYSTYLLHIYDIKKNKYYCIKYDVRSTNYGIDFYINSDLDNSVCTYYRSMDSLSNKFLMYSSAHGYVKDTYYDPNVTDVINCYDYNDFDSANDFLAVNEVNGYFKGLKAFQLPVSLQDKNIYMTGMPSTPLADKVGYPKTIEIRWRFTSVSNSDKMSIISTDSLDYNAIYLIKDSATGRYCIRIIQRSRSTTVSFDSSLLPSDFNPTKWHTICIQGNKGGGAYQASTICKIYIDGILVLNQETSKVMFAYGDIIFGSSSGLAHEPIFDEIVVYDGFKYSTDSYRVNNDYPLIDPYYEPPQPTINFYPTKEKVSAGEYFDLILNSNDILFTNYSLYLNGDFLLSGGGEIKLFGDQDDTTQKGMNFGAFWDSVNFKKAYISEDGTWVDALSTSNISKESETVFNILNTRNYSALSCSEYYENLIDPSIYSILEEGDDKVIYVTIKAHLLDVNAGLIYSYNPYNGYSEHEYYVLIDSVSDDTAVIKIHRLQEDSQSQPVTKEYNVPFSDGLKLKTVIKAYDFLDGDVPKVQISTYANSSLIDTSIADLRSLYSLRYMRVEFFAKNLYIEPYTVPVYSGRVSAKETYCCITKDEAGTLYRDWFTSTVIPQQLFTSGRNTYRIVFNDTDNEQRERTCNVLVEAQDFGDLFVRYAPNFNTKKVLEYKTQIFTSYNHNEERIPLRQCPRVTFEYEYDFSNHESFIGFNNSFNESGLNAIYTVPSWIDAIQVSDTSENITLPTENNFSNDSNVLVFKSFSEYEVVSCTITDNTMVLNNLTDIYTDCIVAPIFSCYLVDAPKLKQQDYKHSVSVKLITAQNVYNGFKNYNTTYLGHDLLVDFYVTSRELTTDVDQDIITTDYDIGLRSLYTLNDRTYNGISFNVQCLINEYPVLQNFIKRRFGKVNPFFIPKETGDLIKKGNGIISTNLNVEMNNFDFDKRPYLFIRLKNGNYLCRKVVSTSANKGTLVLDSALNVKYEDITSVNTLLFVRLDSDKITYKSVGYGMYSVDLSCVEIKFEEYSTITDYDIRP